MSLWMRLKHEYEWVPQPLMVEISALRLFSLFVKSRLVFEWSAVKVVRLQVDSPSCRRSSNQWDRISLTCRGRSFGICSRSERCWLWTWLMMLLRWLLPFQMCPCGRQSAISFSQLYRNESREGICVTLCSDLCDLLAIRTCACTLQDNMRTVITEI